MMNAPGSLGQSLVERDQRRVQSLAERQQIAVTQGLGRRHSDEWLKCLTEQWLDPNGFLAKRYPRIG